ncbi:MAG: isochorismatase family protein [Streptosporangiales bacterium]|nr:isochorismatase family protein [Streptosporangiales bacterium]
MTERCRRPWETYVPTAELEDLAAAGFGARQGAGLRPCRVIVDVVMSFLGPRPGSADPPSVMGCGEMGWARLPVIVDLVETMRADAVPVVFTRGDPTDKAFCGGSIKRTSDAGLARRVHEAPFPPELVPRDDEYVLAKPKASAFFGTPLVSYLVRTGVDTLVLAGATTSGCVRATAVDAASHNFRVAVVEDACFDRSAFAHAANLFDIDLKYGDVVGSGEALTWATTPSAVARERVPERADELE